MTAIPDVWLESTFTWIARHLKGRVNSITFTKHLEKLHLLKERDILVEDCPRYLDYSQVIVIDKSYNRDIALQHTRVHNATELFAELFRRAI